MKKRIFVALALLAGSVTFAQQKKEKQPPPPPPPPPLVVDVKDIPAPPEAPRPKKDYDEFLKRNPTVKAINWSNDEVRVRLKSGKEEVYDMKNEEEVKKLKNKYGEWPSPPPPPPPKVIKVKTVS